MDTRLIEHIIKIADEKSITKAAEQLFLTQSALNQQLLKLERDLGTELFVRSKSDWRPTKAGEIYLEGAKEMLRIKRQTYTSISDVTDSYKGTLTVGMTPFRGPDMFIHVYPMIHEKYPNLVIIPYELNVYKMQSLVASGVLDIGFMTLFDEQKQKNEYDNLFEEEIVIATPKSLNLKNVEYNKESKYPCISLQEIKNQPFIFLRKSTTMRPVVDKIFRNEKVVPKILFDTANPSTILEMVRAGLCCGVIAETTTKKYQEGINYYSFRSPVKWHMMVSYEKGTELSKAAKLFIQTAHSYWVNTLVSKGISK